MGLALLTFVVDAVYPQIFPWNFGYPLVWYKLPIYNFADVIGFQGLSAIVLIINACVLYLATIRASKIKIAQFVLGLLALHILGYVWGLRWPEGSERLKTTIIQANIGNFEKFISEQNSDFRTPIIQKYFELTRRSLQSEHHPDFIIWPETAFPANLHSSVSNQYFQSQLKTFVASIEKPL